MQALIDFPRSPLIVVFPEAALGRQTVARNVTKAWMKSFQQELFAHGNAFVFFSVFENGPSERHRNSGYLVEPKALNETNWKAYPKRVLTEPDLKAINVNSKDAHKSSEMWKRRAKRQEKQDKVFSFPSITIKTITGPKVVELRVCADLYLQNNKRKNIIVVPAAGLNRPNYDYGLNLKRNGFVVINDIPFHTIDGKLLDRHEYSFLKKSRKHLDLVRPRPAKSKRPR